MIKKINKQNKLYDNNKYIDYNKVKQIINSWVNIIIVINCEISLLNY